MPRLAGKTALVTGASRGIGCASALALAMAGAQVLVHYGHGAAEAETVVKEIRAAGGRADVVGADLAAADGPHNLAAKVRRIVGDRLDILVANAGISKAATIAAIQTETRKVVEPRNERRQRRFRREIVGRTGDQRQTRRADELAEIADD